MRAAILISTLVVMIVAGCGPKHDEVRTAPREGRHIRAPFVDLWVDHDGDGSVSLRVADDDDDKEYVDLDVDW